MKGVIGRAVLAVVLLAAGAALWYVANLEQRVADGHRALATLQFAQAKADGAASEQSLRYAGRVPGVGAPLLDAARSQRAAAAYWLGDYASLVPGRDQTGALTEHDPTRLFLAANALYRSAMAEPSPPDVLVRRLDTVLKAYADVLKNTPGHPDASYNYEFVSRKRALLAQHRPATTPKPDAAVTIHGRPGVAPSDKDMSEFKMVIPKRDEERDDPTAGKGGIKVRKG